MNSYLRSQKRVVLRNCGQIDPNSIEEYISSGGYRALKRALLEMEPAAVVQTVKD